MHKVSRGSRFNQIYIPKSMESVFEVGDTVKVELIEKKTRIFSENVKLSEFKEKLIQEAFSFLSKFNISQIFFIGSFLSQKTDYRDIDLLIVSEENENKIYEKLIDKFNLKFHLIVIPEEKFKILSEICPLTRSMLNSYASNKKFELPKQRIDKSHIKFLLMMPEDLLKINAGSRAFYDNIRRLITIRRFLDNKELDAKSINSELKSLLGHLFEYSKENSESTSEMIKKFRKIIKAELKIIKTKQENG